MTEPVQQEAANAEAANALLKHARNVLGKNKSMAQRGACKKCGEIGHLTYQVGEGRLVDAHVSAVPE